MAFEAVDACFGTPHIGSDDLAALNTAMVGKSDCVMEWGDDLELTMSSANTAVIGKGVGMVGGRRFWNDAAQALSVQSGTQGQKRNDLVVARYAKTSAGIESITPVVVRGANTTGTPADPAVTANDLKLWRIPINGITVGTPVRLFTPVTPLATLGDSVSHVEPHGEKDITFTPKVDCDIFVLCAVSGIWGYGGGTITMRVDCDQLEAASKHAGKFSGGNTEAHQLTFWGVFRGAKAGVKYSFRLSANGTLQGKMEATSICMAVHL